MNDISLDDWLSSVAAELGLEELDVDVEQVLDLAAEAAHSAVRPAAPLTTFVAGFAAGLAGGRPEDVREAIDAASAFCARVAEES